MKVLQVSTHVNIGGIGNYILSVSKALKDRGVGVVVASSGGDLVSELEKLGITHIALDMKTKNEFSPKVLKSVFRISKIIKDEKIDVVHAHTRVSQVVSFFASRMTGASYVTTCHGFFKKRLRKIFDTWGLRVIAISDAVKSHLINDLGVAGERVELIYSGVDADRFSRDYSESEIADAKASLGLSDHVAVVGTIGRLSPVKGQKFFIEAMAGCLAKGAKVQGVIIGDGPEGSALKDLVIDLGLEGDLHFFKSSLDTARYLAIMDVFVFPSVKEGLGLSLLEAMAQGRPCIASDIGGISDIIKDGENGILFPVGDTKALGDSIARLLNDAGLRGRLGCSGRELVRRRFALSSMADKIIKVYANK